jgi:hypothetical protein
MPTSPLWQPFLKLFALLKLLGLLVVHEKSKPLLNGPHQSAAMLGCEHLCQKVEEQLC